MSTETTTRVEVDVDLDATVDCTFPSCESEAHWALIVGCGCLAEMLCTVHKDLWCVAVGEWKDRGHTILCHWATQGGCGKSYGIDEWKIIPV